MTSPKHRSTAAPLLDAGTAAAGRTNIWAVAWRLHRIQIAVLLAVAAVGSAGMVLFRTRLLARYAELNCPRFGPDEQGNTFCTDERGIGIWWNDGFSAWSQTIHFAMLVVPVLLGAFAAAPIFTREFSRGTHVLALTQSVSRVRWFTAKTVIVAGPLATSLLALGYLMEWMDGAVGETAFGALGRSNFFARGPIPAATGLMVFGLALAVGMATRTMMTTLVTAIIAGGVVLAGMVKVQPTLLPPEHTEISMAEQFAPLTQAEYDAMNQPQEEENGNAVVVGWYGDDPNEVYLRSGLLDFDGRPLSDQAVRSYFDCSRDAERRLMEAAGVPLDEDGYPVSSGGEDDPTNTLEYFNASNAASLTCATKHHVSATFSDVMPGSRLTPLRWAIGGILVGLGLLFTAAAAWRLRWAVAQR